MDEILHSPQRELPRRRQRKGSAPIGGERAERLKERFSKFMDIAGAQSKVLRRQGTRVYHRAWSAIAGKPKLAPLPFLAISAVVGLAAVVGMWSPWMVWTWAWSGTRPFLSRLRPAWRHVPPPFWAMTTLWITP